MKKREEIDLAEVPNGFGLTLNILRGPMQRNVYELVKYFVLHDNIFGLLLQLGPPIELLVTFGDSMCVNNDNYLELLNVADPT